MGIKEANCYIWTEHLLSLTGEHCEIAQSQAPQQPKQLGTIKHTETSVRACHIKILDQVISH